ncbi:MAG: hypothetical protein ACRCZF_07605, partial [Gemmataceae bacterium]
VTDSPGANTNQFVARSAAQQAAGQTAAAERLTPEQQLARAGANVFVGAVQAAYGVGVAYAGLITMPATLGLSAVPSFLAIGLGAKLISDGSKQVRENHVALFDAIDRLFSDEPADTVIVNPPAEEKLIVAPLEQASLMWKSERPSGPAELDKFGSEPFAERFLSTTESARTEVQLVESFDTEGQPVYELVATYEYRFDSRYPSGTRAGEIALTFEGRRTYGSFKELLANSGVAGKLTIVQNGYEPDGSRTPNSVGSSVEETKVPIRFTMDGKLVSLENFWYAENIPATGDVSKLFEAKSPDGGLA